MSYTLAKRAGALAIFLFAVAALCFGQASRGSITGRVTDAQGAVVPGAAVSVVDTLTGQTTRVTTNQTGYYETVSLDPGTYSVTAEAPGFKKTDRPDIVLETGAGCPSICSSRLARLTSPSK